MIDEFEFKQDPDGSVYASVDVVSRRRVPEGFVLQGEKKEHRVFNIPGMEKIPMNKEAARRVFVQRLEQALRNPELFDQDIFSTLKAFMETTR
jgi:hypothetical protein